MADQLHLTRTARAHDLGQRRHRIAEEEPVQPAQRGVGHLAFAGAAPVEHEDFTAQALKLGREARAAEIVITMVEPQLGQDEDGRTMAAGGRGVAPERDPRAARVDQAAVDATAPEERVPLATSDVRGTRHSTGGGAQGPGRQQRQQQRESDRSAGHARGHRISCVSIKARTRRGITARTMIIRKP